MAGQLCGCPSGHASRVSKIGWDRGLSHTATIMITHGPIRRETFTRDISGFHFFIRLVGWSVTIALRCYWSAPAQSKAVSASDARDPQPLTRCSASGLDAMMLHYIVRDFLDWTPIVICTCCRCDAIFFAVFPTTATCARRPVAYTPVPGNAPPLLRTTIPRSLEM